MSTLIITRRSLLTAAGLTLAAGRVAATDQSAFLAHLYPLEVDPLNDDYLVEAIPKPIPGAIIRHGLVYVRSHFLQIEESPGDGEQADATPQAIVAYRQVSQFQV